jgi:hypothetical protein
MVLSAVVCAFANPLMLLFVDAGETEILREGCDICILRVRFTVLSAAWFLLYGLYRALGKPGMSVVLTVISLVHPRCPRLPVVLPALNRRDRHLVVRSHRLGACRFCRICVLLKGNQLI